MAEKTEITSVSREQIIQALKQVYDPEIPVDIYALGLIYEITIYPLNNVQVLMTLTSPSCPAAEMIPGQVEASIKAIEGVNEVQIELTFEPPYSQTMMSEEAKLALGFL
ncbi:MAG: iron-sulfur cluster assembly protein [Amoebophilaceae bacterium]|jgi:FeS assembly SUF system protein|nr:iron-sulfur cluster assembly protein [Amoebophilaceae bacterium]